MKHFLSNKVVKHIGLGVVLVVVVTFLTLMFSLLGAISCAVVCGMILGVARQGTWRSILVSLVFPAVTLVVAHASHALEERQNIQFSLVCLGSYWVAYILTYGLVLLERKPPQPKAQNSVADTLAFGGDTYGQKPGLDTPTPVLSAVSADPGSALEPHELRGKWSCKTTDVEGQPHTKTMEIDGDRIVLSVTDSRGRQLTAAKGGMRLEEVGPFRTLRISNWEVNSLDRRGEHAVSELIWVYRIEGQRLSLALNLDSSPQRPPPMVETYFKLP